MKIVIDTDNKVIEIIERVNFLELYEFMRNLEEDLEGWIIKETLKENTLWYPYYPVTYNIDTDFTVTDNLKTLTITETGI